MLVCRIVHSLGRERLLAMAEGFAPLPRRRDEERPQQPRPTVEPVADVRQFSLSPRTFTTDCVGLFLFVADLVRLGVQKLAQAAGLREGVIWRNLVQPGVTGRTSARRHKPRRLSRNQAIRAMESDRMDKIHRMKKRTR